jgi:opacity protein-like surface antigen
MSKLSKLVAGTVIAATAGVGGASVALADEYATKKVTYERPADWSGVYFGVGSGYQWSSIDVSHERTIAEPSGIGISSDHDEVFVSAHIGYQTQFTHPWGLIVLGIEGGWMSTLRDREGNSAFCDSVRPVLENPIEIPGNFCRATLNDILTIGARVGWAAGHWMPYVTGGYANAGVDFENRVPFSSTGTPLNFGATTLQEQAHARLGGWYIGGGFEWVVSPGWTTGIEYRHYDFGSRDTTAFQRDFGVPSVALEGVRFEASTDTVEARVSWRWGRPETPAPLK